MDKNKIIQNAQKYVQKGQIDKAIKEYTKIVDADPKDVRTWLKIGDLHAKKGSGPEAAATYMRVAETYSQQGFFLKAVAVYKQILKLQPDLVDVNLRLADLYHQLGLLSDAMAQFQSVVGFFEAAGDLHSVFETLRKMLDIDPDNVATRIKLAEMYSKENMVAEAVQEFRNAGAWLKERNRIDDYVKVVERLVFHTPDDLDLTRELAKIYLAKGDTKRSLAKLQICFKADPRDVETLHLLGQAFLELGQTSKTVSVYKELAKIHGDAGRIEEQRAAWKKVLELAPDDREAQMAMGSGRPEAAAMPTAGPPPGAAASRAGPPPGAAPSAGRPPGAAPSAGRPPGAAPVAGRPPGAAPATAQPQQVSPAAAVAKLLTETDVYVKYGLHDKALEHLKKVFAIVPTHLEAHEKAKGLFEASGNTEAAGHELVTLIQLTIESDAERARGYLKELANVAPQLPEFKGFVEKLGQPEVEQISFLDSADAALPDEDDDFVIAGDDDDFLVADDGDGFTDELEPDEDVFGVDIAQEESDVFGVDIAQEESDVFVIEEPEVELEVGEPEADVEVSGELVAEQEEDDAFVIDDDLLTGEDLDEVMAEAAQAVGDEAGAGEAKSDPFELEDSAEDSFGDLDDGSLDDEVGLVTDHGIDLEGGIDEGSFRDSVTDMVAVSAVSGVSRKKPEREFGRESDPTLHGVPDLEMPDMDGGSEDPALLDDDDLGAASDDLPDLDDEDLDAAAAAIPDLDDVDLGAAADDLPDLDDMDLDAGIDDSDLGESELDAATYDEDDLGDSDLGAGFDDDDPAAPESTIIGDASDEVLGHAAFESAEEEEPAPASAGGASEEMADELEEAQFFLEQGLPDEAREVVQGILESYPYHPGAQELLARIDAEAGEDDFGVPDVDVGDLDDPEEGEQRFDTDEEPEATAEEGFDSFDLAGELADELAEIEDDEGEAPLDDFQISADDVFAEFKKGVAKAVGSEDADTHYDLGIAYREMGLTADAIGEFDLASKQPKKRVDSLTMIGLCHRELGNLDAAIEAYQEALTTKGLKPDAAKAVNYDLGTAFEEMGDKATAARHFKKTVSIDPKFRDAKSRLEAIGDVAGDDVEHGVAGGGKNGVPGDASSEDDSAGKPRPRKSDKVGYV